MIKFSKLFLTLLLIGSAISAFGGPVSTYGNLQIQFSPTFNCMTICSQAGVPVQLRGMSTMGLQWYPVSALGVNKLATDWGSTVVRAAMYVGEGGYIGNETAMTNKVKTIVDAAIAKDIYVIIDWHILSDNNPKINYSAAVAFFTNMSKLYGNKPNVIWEICNEPNGATTWQDIKDYAVGGNGVPTGIIDIIRNNDPDNATNKNIIIVGTPNWSQKVWLANADPIDPVKYPNIAYTFHFYASSRYHDFMNSPEWAGLPDLGLAEGADGIGNAADTTLSLGKIALFVTEWGICEETGSGVFDVAKSDQYVNWMATRNVSWTNWSLCNKGETASALAGAGNGDTGWNDATDLSASGIYVKNRILAGATPVPTNAATPDPTAAPGETPIPVDTPIPGACTCPNGCNSTTTITSPFVFNGAGEFCFQASSLGDSINSWNTDIVNINGITFTNNYVGSGSYPAPINGNYYVYYKATGSGAHLEIVGAGASAPPADTVAPTPDTTQDPAIPVPTTAPSGNLALNKTASSSSVQSPNVALNGNDGNTGTRWCASSSKANEWWMVDLGAAYSIATTSVTWESSGVVYKYKVEVSTNNSTWTKVADKTANTSTAQTQTDTFTAVSARYVRITVTTPPTGKWASFSEFTVK